MENYVYIYIYFLQGDQPMIVVATAGTTVGGAYDPINKLADITEKYNIWLHVDVSFACHSEKPFDLIFFLKNYYTSLSRDNWDIR